MGAAARVELPVGLVTLLFSDIEGSTALLRELGDDYEAVLADHYRLLREVWSAHGGVEVNTEGDAFFVAFADPGQAVRAAAAGQRALRRHRWPEGGQVRVRMGLHTGSPRVRDADYWGIDVHYAARLCAAAHGGQVLVSDSTAAMVDLELEDLGEHAVKDFPSPRRVFHLSVDGMGSDAFPRPRMFRAGRTNLPDSVSSFVGRERDLAELRERLAGCRLVTLTGAGGVGKTRLALRLGAELLDGSGDGVWLVDLAPVTDAALVASTVAKVLGVPEQPGRAVDAAIVDAVADRRLLVVLDNCEHLLSEVASLASTLLARCPRLSVLATSREPLRVDGEQVFRVPPLSVPAENVEDPDVVRACEGPRLFVERAAQQRRGFALGPDNAGAIGRICRRLDGIPFAIELATVRLRSLSLDDLEARLDRRFALLTGGARVTLPRQQTLLALIGWSYQLLSSSERRVLAHLAVFPSSGFDLEAAERVCGEAIDRFEVLDHLDALVDKSLVQAEDSSGRIRYRLLESVREYAMAKLVEQGDGPRASAHRAHREHYLELAETARRHLHAPDAPAWMERLEIEHDNLRTALRDCLRDPDPEPGLCLAGALAEFWRDRGHAVEGANALDVHLDRPEASPRTLARSHALIAASWLHATALSDYCAGRARAQEALAIARAEHDDHLTATALRELVWVALRQGADDEALSLCDEAVGLARQLDDQYLLAQLVNMRGAAMANLGRDGRPDLEEGLALSRRIGNAARIATALANIGNLELAYGNLGNARAHFEEALAIFRDLGDLQDACGVSVNLAFVSYLEQDHVRAAELFAEALATHLRLGDPEALAWGLLGTALTTVSPETASILHGAADVVLEQIGYRLEPFESRLREADRTRLQDAIGPDAFHTGYEAGRALPRSEAVTLARGAAPGAPTHPHAQRL